MTRMPVRSVTALAAVVLLPLAAACASAPAGDEAGGGGARRTFTLRLTFPDGIERVEVLEGETARLERSDAVYEFVPRISKDRGGHVEMTIRRIGDGTTREGVLVKPMTVATGIDFSTTGLDLAQELGDGWPSIGVKIERVRPPVLPGSWMPSG